MHPQGDGSAPQGVFSIEAARLIGPSDLASRGSYLNPPDASRRFDDVAGATTRIDRARAIEKCHRAIELFVQPPLEPRRRRTLAVVGQEI
jgi:hypothetical protein